MSTSSADDGSAGDFGTQSGLHPQCLHDEFDYVGEFVSRTRNKHIPELFAEWGALYTLGVACGRGLVTQSGLGRVAPNLYLLLCSPPGAGKSLLENFAREIFSKADIECSPSITTLQAMTDIMSRNPIDPDPTAVSWDEQHGDNTSEDDDKNPTILSDSAYHQLNLITGEFKETFPTKDTNVLQTLSSWWDFVPEINEAKRKWNKPKQVKDPKTGKIRMEMEGGKFQITNPNVHILACVQPSIFAGHFPNEAWNAGFLARAVIVFVADKGKRNIWEKPPEDDNADVFASFLQHLRTHTPHVVEFSDKAKAKMIDWAEHDFRPVPSNPKCESYNGRREHQIIKLAFLYAVSRSHGSIPTSVTERDVHRALRILLLTEQRLPDFFETLTIVSSESIVQDVKDWLGLGKHQGQPVPFKDFAKYVASKCEAHNITQMIVYLRASGVIEDFTAEKTNIAMVKLADDNPADIVDDNYNPLADLEGKPYKK